MSGLRGCSGWIDVQFLISANTLHVCSECMNVRMIFRFSTVAKRVLLLFNFVFIKFIYLFPHLAICIILFTQVTNLSNLSYLYK